MGGEREISHEHLWLPHVGDIIRLNPGRRTKPEGEKWVVWSVEGISFGAGRLFEMPDGSFELTGPGTFYQEDFAEPLGQLDLEQMLEAHYKRMGGALSEDAKRQIRMHLEQSFKSQLPEQDYH